VSKASRLELLRRRLRRACRESGTRAQLARFLGKPLPRVSEYLRDKDPIDMGGETTLACLEWLEKTIRKT